MTNITTSLPAKTAAQATMAAEACAVVWEMRWMLVLIATLLAADLWFGLSEAKKKNRNIRLSRAARRTANKAVDYMMYLMLGTIVGLAVTEPLGWATHTTTAAAALALAAICEVDSILNHFCTLRGMNMQISLGNILTDIIKKKTQDITQTTQQTWQTTDYSSPSSSDGKEDSPTTPTTEEDPQTKG